jgi:hypothetical protein
LWGSVCHHVEREASRFIPSTLYFGVDARLALMIGIAQGWPGAQSAYDDLYQIIGVQTYVNGVSDLANRAGWALQ